MKPGKNYYKEGIKKRIEEEFPHAKDDPVINIFTEACAAEFAEIKDELDEFKTNFIHELSKSFARGLLFGPKPAHALMKCVPREPVLKVPAFSKFEFPVSNPVFSDSKSFAFSTVADHTVFNLNIERIERKNNGKEPKHKKIIDNELWLCLTINDPAFSINDLVKVEDLLIYFTLANGSDVEQRVLLSALKECQSTF